METPKAAAVSLYKFAIRSTIGDNCLRYAHPAEANLRLEAERLRDRDARRLRGIYGRAQLGEVAPWSDDCIALKNNSSSMGRSTVHLEYRISLESKPGRQKSPIFPW